jgi:hypothetical protein
MIPRFYIAAVAASSMLLAACADVPSDPESQAKLAAQVVPVQPVQPGDNQLTCDSLAASIRQTQWAISALDLQINEAANASTGFSLLGALSAATGALATNVSQVQTSELEGVVANTGGAISNNVGMSKANIRATYQARYDNLVGIFNGKACTPST